MGAGVRRYKNIGARLRAREGNRLRERRQNKGLGEGKGAQSRAEREKQTSGWMGEPSLFHFGKKHKSFSMDYMRHD